MAKRTRPAGCCRPLAVKPLSAGRLEQMATVAKALADPNRIQILRFVNQQRGPVCACDIVSQFDLSQPTVSHHLKLLREARLVRNTRKGLWMFYESDPKGGAALREVMRLVPGVAPS